MVMAANGRASWSLPTLTARALLCMLFVVLVSCRNCTELGCVSGVMVHWANLSESHEVCVGDACLTTSGDAGFGTIELASTEDRHGVTVVAELDGEATATIDVLLSDFKPNGGGCPPTCHTARVQLEPGGLEEMAG